MTNPDDASGDTVRPDDVSWAQCRELARTLRGAEHGRRVVRQLRPRGNSGVWSSRGPLTLRLWLAGAQGRLVQLPPSPATPLAFAVIEAPGIRRRGLVTGGKVRWLNRVDLFWDVLVFLVPPILLLAITLIIGLPLRPLGDTGQFVVLCVALVVVLWAAAGLTAMFLRDLIGGVRSVESGQDPATGSVKSLLYQHWSIAALHAADTESAVAVHAMAQDRMTSLWTSFTPRLDDIDPYRHVVNLDGVSSTTAEAAVRSHRYVSWESLGTSPRITVIGHVDGRHSATKALQNLGAAGIFYYLFAVIAVMPLLAFIVSGQESTATGGQQRPLASFGAALRWLIEQFIWIGGGPDEILFGTRLFGWLMRPLSLMTVIVIVIAARRDMARGRAIDAHIEEVIVDTEQSFLPTIALVTALPEEFTAVRTLLENERREHREHDQAIYLSGDLPSAIEGKPHRVVLVQITSGGTRLAAATSTHALRSYPSVRHVVMVGIACGVPRVHEPDRHVRLGDIVASTWGLVAYDHVDDRPQGQSLRAQPSEPAHMFLTAANFLESEGLAGRRPWQRWIDEGVRLLPDFARPDERTDVVRTETGAVLAHPPRTTSHHPGGEPTVHLGRIGSADRSRRDATSRDEDAEEFQVLAFEMEGAGVSAAAFTNGTGWFMVRGISDYGGSDTDRTWRKYAALAAAGYLKALLAVVPPLREHVHTPVGEPGRRP